MIRFINLTGQILSQDKPHFAWFDTVRDRFMEFYGNQEWNTWKEFEQDLRTYLVKHRSSLYIPGTRQEDDEFYKQRENEIVSRFKGLFQFKNHPTKTSPSSKE